MRKSDLFFNVLRLPVDFVMLLAAGIVTYLLRTKILSVFRPVLFEFNLPIIKYLYIVIFVSFLFLASYAISGLYSLKIRRRIIDEFFKIVVASLAGIMVVIIYIFLRQELFDSRFLVLGGWFFAILFVFIGRLIVRYLQSVAASRYDFAVHRVLVIGEDDTASRIIKEIKNNSFSGYRLVNSLPNPTINELELITSKDNVDEIIFSNKDYFSERISG